MKKTIHSTFSGHTFFVSSCDSSELPKDAEYVKSYSKFYKVQNFNATGHTFMYLGKGTKEAPNQIVVWYPSGRFWSGFGTTLEEAIIGAQKDGWMFCIA